ncbi:TIGR04290 family methyltransferase [Legionella jordanis]|uniref:3-demethylubiquinone-9 3-methyltransferase n=1 Tax=Legionella jordanis TaxID=456 RepID=A0A0W0VG37_9GAMM|nr:TIGR04290 family methyltransferase [Legionella jordanis]KTD19050.1 3-demethylubiquinone-9 3-methyltransferase [Legionella jordanis]RMX05395.1 TIGR04290 family methyltransferase [Legionella jordanis]VEH13153.1 3-demethylubiquinone-9 3-methyltransferase [Legionella jordanis]HAT8714810.1 TIGR04290 family methyltransferase [Legionella jordanis]
MIVEQEIKKLEPWFHNIHLPDGNQTAPDHFLGDFPSFKWQKIQHSIPQDLTGWRVLDIGCNAGFYSVELAKRGADVVAIDLDPHYLRQAHWVASQFGLEDKITFKCMQVYDLAHTDDEFDLVWFMGVFYHLRYPLLALDIITQKVKNIMVFQTLSVPGTEEMQIPDDIGLEEREILKNPAFPFMAFIEKRLVGDPTNWWVPNHQCVLSMLANCGFDVAGMPEKETYIAVKKKDFKPDFATWNLSEYLSAIGKEWKDTIDSKVKN